MKILFINNVFPPGFIGGYELGAFEIANGLKAQGHQISILTSDYFQDDAGELLAFHVERTLECTSLSHYPPTEAGGSSRGAYVNQGNIRRLGSALRRLTPDVVLLFNLMGLGALGILQFLQACSMPTVLYLMDNVFYSVDRSSSMHAKYIAIFGKPGVGPGTKVIAMSGNVMKEVRDSLAIDFGNVSYIPGWVQVPERPTAPSYSNDAAEVRFVVCSRVAPHKGTEFVVDATENLVRRGVTGFSIDVYGAGMVAAFLQNIQAKDLSLYIRYLGIKPKEEMLRLFSEYDALLFPTWEREPFGFAVGEAAAAGCFPIMTAGIGASEWFVSDVDCIKIQRTTDSLAAAMVRTICMSADDRLQLRRAAMKSARRNLPFDRWIKVIEQTCVQMQGKRAFDSCTRSRGVEAAFLFLGCMWESSLG
jgi:glycosyltransferase involved in cell wall biosynthesis